ncbi:MAG TPA: S1 RNA-binding domain-containing protein, partial [Desulfobacterales bacterium]|nr:S1 RNA-binding domain-containing protein [Desulfobacterales bacterium]
MTPEEPQGIAVSDEQRTEDQSPAAGAPVAENGASANRPKKRSSRSRSRRSAREAVDRLVATLAGPAAAPDAKDAETARVRDSSPEAESPPEERAADTAPDTAAGEDQPKKTSRRRRRPRRRAKGQKPSQAGQAAEEQQPEAGASSGPETKEDEGRDAGETAVSETAPAPATGGDAGEEAKTAAPPQEGKKPGKSAARQNKSGPVLKLLINAEEPEECRIVLLEDSKVEAFHIETVGREKTKGNIYKGVIVAVEPSLQAAFVDFGTEKNGFLPFGDIHPEYYNQEVDEDTHWSELHIQDVIDKGQEVLVEVVKEAAGGKGAALTTYLSLPGRYLVLMPGSDSHGISRKLSDEERAALRKMVEDF